MKTVIDKSAYSTNVIFFFFFNIETNFCCKYESPVVGEMRNKYKCKCYFFGLLSKM